MRILITLESPATVSLPVNYNYFLTSMIYRNLPQSFAFIHDNGYAYEKRKFKFFTFSWLQGHYSFKGNTLLMDGKISFIFSSPIDTLAKDMAKSILSENSVAIGNVILNVESVNILPDPDFSSEMYVKMLSPVTMYSTLKTAEGKKKTYYYSPFEKEFSQLIEKNILKKYKALNGKENNNPRFLVTPIGRQKEVFTNYKGTVVRAWNGIFKMEGSPDLMKLAYDAGIGGKNPEGFGCFDVIRRDIKR
ncbi:MAG: CRISPR-associated endoribonuclease Cas6 [Conexivisphaerales archaeon]